MTPDTGLSPAQLVQLVTVTARPVILGQFAPDSCIASTRVVIEALRYFGVPAAPWGARVQAYSGLAWDLHERHVPAADWPEQARIVQIDPAIDGDHVGHVTVIAQAGPPGCRRILSDPSIDQASRPQRGIPLAPFTAPVCDDFDLAGDGALVYEGPAGVRLVYAPSRSKSYTRSPNWQRSHPAIRSCAAATINAVRDLTASRT